MKKLTNFPENRYKHCYSVGKKMYQYAKDVLKWDENTCVEMFVLGNLHDIGYEMNGNCFGHDKVLADALHGSYRYSNEIELHAGLQKRYDTPAMRLLYFADMTVDGEGNWCTFEERLQDIRTRYGKESEEYKESVQIAEYLIKLGFNDSLIEG